MSRADWYRRSTWTDEDRAEFDTRLRRARSSASKAQYLRIQAVHLEQAGLHREAIELLDRMLGEYPERLELGMAHLQKAKSLGELGQTEDAVREFRAAVQADADYPNVQTGAWLAFAWYVAVNELSAHYDEALGYLDTHRNEPELRFAIQCYKEWAVRALIAGRRENMVTARDAAVRALSEAERSNSGLRYHPTVGLVGEQQRSVEERLRRLAADV